MTDQKNEERENYELNELDDIYFFNEGIAPISTTNPTKMDLSDPHLYHLLINNDKFSVAEIADIIIERIGKFQTR